MHFHSLAAVTIPDQQENHEENRRIAEYLAQVEQQMPDEPYGIGRKLMVQELKARLNTFSRSVINAVEEVMEPYGCESESYYEFCDQTENVRCGYENDACDCIRLPEGTIVSAHEYQIRKAFQIIRGQVFQKEAGQLHRPKRTRKTRKMKALLAYPMKKLYKTMHEYALDYCAYQYDEKEQGYGYYCNPNSMWDWYQIGGRWPVTFLVKDSCTEFAPGERSWGNDKEEYPCPEGYMWVSAARKKDIAWQVMKDWYLNEARKRFQALEAMYLYGTMDPEKHLHVKEGYVYSFLQQIYKIGETEDEFLRRCGYDSERKYPVSFCDLISSDDWVSQGSVHAKLTDEERESSGWLDIIEDFIDNLDDDTVLVSVDYHM